jgi:hypothetical protein
LVVPCDHQVTGTRVRRSHVLLSDDGKSWKLVGLTGPGCNEAQAVELSDGRSMLNTRSYRHTHRPGLQRQAGLKGRQREC